MVGAAALATGSAVLASAPAEAQTAPAHQYSDALQKALWFYHQQRSGLLPPDQPVIWRGPSCLKDGQDIGRDLTGGYFDAGDHVKFGLPMAATVTLLCWSLHESAGAYAQLSLAQALREAIRWGTDYFIKCHVADREFVYQVGSGSADHGWWGPAESVEEVMARPSYKATMASPASTVVAATAAALAAASVVLRGTDAAYADTCLARARSLYEFADATRSDAGYTAARGFYDSYTGFWDELAAAATWLHLATGDPSYLTRAEAAALNWGREGRNGTVWRYKWTLSWDDMHYMTQILLARITGKAVYVESVERNLEFMLPGGGVVTTPGGLAWVDKWGSLRYAANAAFLALVWAREPLGNTSRKSVYRNFGEGQINYILGSNPRQSSYLIGYGNNWPKNPHLSGRAVRAASARLRPGVARARAIGPAARGLLAGAAGGRVADQFADPGATQQSVRLAGARAAQSLVPLLLRHQRGSGGGLHRGGCQGHTRPARGGHAERPGSVLRQHLVRRTGLRRQRPLSGRARCLRAHGHLHAQRAGVDSVERLLAQRHRRLAVHL